MTADEITATIINFQLMTSSNEQRQPLLFLAYASTRLSNQWSMRPRKPRRGDNLQQLKVEVDAIGAHLRGLFLTQFAHKGIWRQPMAGILTLQPASGLALVLSIVRVPQKEQIRDHLVLLVSG